MNSKIDWSALGVECLFEKNIREEAPRVTVQMITYGHEHYIVQAVSTILEQTYRDFELIISDDASPDRTKEVLLAYLNTYQGDGQVRYLRQLKNGGLEGRGHRFIFAALRRGEIILSMDGDDYSMPNRLEKTVEIWDSLEPKPSMLVVNAIEYLDKEKREAGLSHREFDCPLHQRRFYPPANPIDARLPVFGSGSVYSKRFLDKIRNIPQCARVIAGDVVTARRAMLDCGIWLVNEPLFYYRVRAGSVSGSGVNGKRWIHDRYMRWVQLESDMKALSPDHQLSPDVQSRLDYWKKRTQFSESLIDCSNWIWPFRWVRFLFYSLDGARGALKCRIKLLLFGDVNASFRGRKTFKSQVQRRIFGVR